MLLQIQDDAADYIDAKETAVKALKQDRIPCRRPLPSRRNSMAKGQLSMESVAVQKSGSSRNCLVVGDQPRRRAQRACIFR